MRVPGHDGALFIRRSRRDRRRLFEARPLAPRGRRVRRKRLYMPRVPGVPQRNQVRRLVQLQPQQVDARQLRLLSTMVSQFWLFK